MDHRQCYLIAMVQTQQRTLRKQCQRATLRDSAYNHGVMSMKQSDQIVYQVHEYGTRHTRAYLGR